jgi:hypothetical protein
LIKINGPRRAIKKEKGQSIGGAKRVLALSAACGEPHKKVEKEM